MYKFTYSNNLPKYSSNIADQVVEYQFYPSLPYYTPPTNLPTLAQHDGSWLWIHTSCIVSARLCPKISVSEPLIQLEG